MLYRCVEREGAESTRVTIFLGTPKRVKVEPIRQPTLSQMEKFETVSAFWESHC